MITQYKYAFRHGAVLRVTTFGIVFAVNLVFGALAYFGVLGFAASVTAVSLSGVGLSVVIIMNIITGAMSIKSVLGSTSGYIYALAPVKSSRILFARLSAIVVQDVFTLAVSIYGTVWLSFYLAGVEHEFLGSTIEGVQVSPEVFKSMILGLAFYAFIYMFVIFCAVLKKSILFNKKAKSLLTLLCGLGIFWILSLVDFIMFPFALVERWFIFFNLTLYSTFGTVLYVMLILAKTAVLFIAASRLMDRRMNY